jgi:hypothetical protein
MIEYLSSRGYLSGTGDESARCQAWLTDAAAQRKRAWLEPGAYDVQDVLLSDVTIDGEPGRSTFRLRAGATARLMFARGRVELNGITLDGQAARQAQRLPLIVFDGRGDSLLRCTRCSFVRTPGFVIDCRSEFSGLIEILSSNFRDLPEVGVADDGKPVPSVGVYANQGNGGSVRMIGIRAEQSTRPAPTRAPCLIQVGCNSASKKMIVEIRDVYAKWFGSRATGSGIIDLYDSTPDSVVEDIVGEEPGWCIVKAQNAPRLRVGKVRWIGEPLTLFPGSMVDVAAGVHYAPQPSDSPDIGPVTGDGPTGGPVVRVVGSPGLPIKHPHVEVHCSRARAGVLLQHVEDGTVVGTIAGVTGQLSHEGAVTLINVRGATLHADITNAAGYGVVGLVGISGTIEVSGTITGCTPAKVALRNTSPDTHFVATRLVCQGPSPAFDVDASRQDYLDCRDDNNVVNSNRFARTLNEARNSWNR